MTIVSNEKREKTKIYKFIENINTDKHTGLK